MTVLLVDESTCVNKIRINKRNQSKGLHTKLAVVTQTEKCFSHSKALKNHQVLRY